MAGNEQAKNDFNSILTSLDRKFDIIHVKWSETKYFESKFRTQIPRNSDDFNTLCDEWVDNFSKVTSTIWVKKISNTGPKIRFRKQYQCWPQTSKEVQKELLFDSRRCKGTLDMKVLTDNPLTRRKNKHIRMGLNVVVKINFTHLHHVNTLQPFAFFVHTCEPQLEAPRPAVQVNSDKLSQRVAEMVQKGLNASPKVVNPNLIATNKTIEANDIEVTFLETDQVLQHNQLQLLNMDSVNLNQTLPLHNASDLKVQVQPTLQQLTQVLVSTPQLDISEPLLMCQPALMFDPAQVIPVSAHHIPHHFVQVHSHNISNQHGHYL
ncbi:hypothetical protein RI129_011111 [Pyrocoelia pectoralis]|uniref:Uncharacterized protein n=1 Tax=Pyrocoelia pectoralis TaxID=417401 RepID=A0AAN7V0E8_9COLE